MEKFRIHFRIGDYTDYIDIEGETIEEVKEITKRELKERGAEGLYSERI